MLAKWNGGEGESQPTPGIPGILDRHDQGTRVCVCVCDSIILLQLGGQRSPLPNTSTTVEHVGLTSTQLNYKQSPTGHPFGEKKNWHRKERDEGYKRVMPLKRG